MTRDINDWDEPLQRYFTVTLRPVIEFKDWDTEDKEYFGKFEVKTFGLYADDYEDALDSFHSDVPIACLDDFEISIEEG